MRSLIRVLVVSLSMTIAMPAAVANEPPGGPEFALYDPDPDHLWNRLHRTLFMRVSADGKYYGHDDFELLYWSLTKHLTTGRSHAAAVVVLEEFLESDSNASSGESIKYALLQHDLWALFDWVASRMNANEGERLVLLRLLAQAINAVALDPWVIESLPNNYGMAVESGAYPAKFAPKAYTPFLPPDLLRGESTGVRIVGSGHHGPESHLEHTDGRSLFWTYIRLPGGFDATQAYVERLRDFPKPYEFGPDRRLSPQADGQRAQLSHALPQFPDGTQVALVQQMMLIDSNGEITPTQITESVQIRVYETVEPNVREENAFGFWEGRSGDQRPFEFRLSRSALLSGEHGGLVPMGIDDERHHVFRSHGFDGFEQWSDQPAPRSQTSSVLQRCNHCHQGLGIHSVPSVKNIVGTPEGWGPRQGMFHTRVPTREDEIRNAVAWKDRRYSWGLLQGLLITAD